MGWRFKSQKTFNPEPVYAAAKHRWPKWQWYTLLAVVMLPLLYLVGQVVLSLTFVTASSSQIITDTILLNAPDQSYVSTISVEVGDTLKKGQLVLTLSVPGLEAKKEFLASQIVLLTKLKKDDLNQQGIALQQAQAAAIESLHSTKAHYEDFERYYKDGVLTIMDLQAAERRYRQANLDLQKINAELASNQQQYVLRTTENETKLEDLQEQLKALKEQTALYALTSPVENGVLSQLLVQPQEYVTDGQELAVISTPNHLAVRALFNANFLKNLTIGRKAYIVLPDYRIIHGVIRSVPLATEGKVNNPLFADLSENKVVAILDCIEPLPEKYHSAGIPVRVFL